VKDITSMVANFTWDTGYNHGGGLRWVIATPDGEIWVHDGDLDTQVQSGVGGTGVNMAAPAMTEARVEMSQLNGADAPMYDTWDHVLADKAADGTPVPDEPVSYVALVLDGGWGGDQVLNLASASVDGHTFNWPAASGPVQDNSAPAYIALTKVSGSDPGPIDESYITSTQGDTGGQFRQVDGMYMYNLPVAQLPDLSASYKVWVSFNPDLSNPVDNQVKFGLK
jgi:hypothetical protein